MYFELIAPTDYEKLCQWDEFLMNSPRGHFSQLSTWLRSFQPYGFDFRVLLARENQSGMIIGGIGLLHFNFLVYTLLSAPMGPILETGYENACKDILGAALTYARTVKAFFFQCQVPYSESIVIPATLPFFDLPTTLTFHRGLVFRTGNAPGQMLWIDFSKFGGKRGASQVEELLKQFNNNTRRNIIRSERNNLHYIEAATEDELRDAYAIIERNGQELGYATRKWKDIRKTLIDQVNHGQAIILIAFHGGQSLGAHYGILAGQRYSYIMGGTLRLKSDFRAGHFIHWTAIKKALELGKQGYDFTTGGSEGVMQFKMGFRPTRVDFVPPVYYILSKAAFQAFQKIYPILRRHKSTVANLLSKLKHGNWYRA